MNKTEIIGEIEHYTLKKLLGDGVYGDAYLAYNAKTDSETCLKVTKSLEDEIKKTFEREIDICSQIPKHANIVSMIEHGKGQLKLKTTAGSVSKEVIYIEYELCPEGDLFDFVSS